MLTQASAHRKDTNAPLTAELQHRHFAFIAAVLANMKPTKTDATFKLRTQEWRGTVHTFADACAGTNPRFDRRRFLLACGESDSE